jgi:lysophospholipase L1-like esterase
MKSIGIGFSTILHSWTAVLLTFCSILSAAETQTQSSITIAADHPNLLWSPYVWKQTGNGGAGRAEAVMPGAYLKAVVQGTTTVGLIVDATANRDCPASSMPVIEYSIDEGGWQVVPLKPRNEVYRHSLADGLALRSPHRVEIYFRAADLTQSRWKSSTAHLSIAGLSADAGASLQTVTARSKKAIAFGDSITEGVGVDGLFKSWQSLEVNNARATWFPFVASALDCEYGQLGSGGHGMTRTIHLPPLPQSWDRYDAATSRLKDGQLLPEPDYVFCAMGTNDYEKDITGDYVVWLTDMRKACPHTRFFCVVPPLGVHQAEIKNAVENRRQAGDPRVYMIETAPLRGAFRAGQGATQLGYDGVHPSEYGQAMLGALIAVEVQKVLDRDE